MSSPLLLEARDLVVDYQQHGLLRAGAAQRALHGVSLQLDRGQALAVVGESGSGKSTLARALLRLLPMTSGQVLLRGEDLAILTSDELRARRRDLQMIFQDPLASLDPRMRISEILAQPLRVFEPDLDAAARRERAVQALQQVGLDAAALQRWPHEFSGGQAQRIGIARALLAQPALLLCDEPVSALDLPIRLQVLQLLAQQRAQAGVALLFIAHDLAAVRFLCERTLVLYRGQVMEQGPTAALFASPQHPYTQSLLAAALSADPRAAAASRVRRRQLAAASSPAAAVTGGCVFAARCAFVQPQCAQAPVLRQVGEVQVACHRAGEPALQVRGSVISS
jgi:oligopeptide transport system ATP-binding protein